MDYFLWYLKISYAVGLLIFMYEMGRSTRLMGFGIVLLLLSPLTAWHGVLHYMAVCWHRARGTKFEPWI